MTYTVSIVTAHELAHIMGVDHDTDNSGYVMAPSISTTHTNRWQFSLASKNAFDDLFAKPSSSCLRRTTIDRTALSANMTVALANPDTICRRAKANKGSYMCKNPMFYGNAAPQGDRVCTRIWCRKVNTKMCYPTFPSEGLICGKNKRCNDGTCQDHPDTESAVVDPECIWGDQAKISFVWSNVLKYEGNCAGLERKYGHLMCYDADVARYCCCEFGDFNYRCNHNTQADICEDSSDVCCLFCQGYKKTRSSESSRNVSGVTNDLSFVTIKVIDDLKAIPIEPYKQTAPPEED
ncbi:A disintegrin and metalloproteinase with thrombospondin motifs 1 [Plakobranchus ocellatus]|uniref:A disintegrin and metalloproteinase with thrombospondin motifs 1 n=1 Tax=Plakobranchus ocellatus TaxID=259542 RepID=A0AAV4BLA5_9GAST|nr:A disintegrin and metalloproteinase with thrombospondin motifs 1 [Plakobranchus ocellatus]